VTMTNYYTGEAEDKNWGQWN